MPDLEFERIELNAIPSGDMPVFHASQYETKRPFISDLKWGEADFAPGEGCWCTLSIRKTDDTLVIIDEMDIVTNEVSCVLPQQAVACVGDNFCQLKVWSEEDGEDGCIACLNFILHVQPDPEAGGLTSESEINNLTEQIEEITQQVIGDDYYTKDQTDTLLAVKADISDLPDMTQYYTKTATDTLLAAKADASDTYTKSQVDSALTLKADVSTTYTKSETDTLLDNKVNNYQIDSGLPIGDVVAAKVEQAFDSDIGFYDKVSNRALDVYTKQQVDNIILDIMPVGTSSGAVANFNTALTLPMVNVSCDIVATGGNGTPDSPIPINGYTEANITRCGVNLLHVNSRVSQTTAQVIYTSDDNYIEMNGTKYGGTYADLSALEITLPAGTYYLKAFEISGTATNAPSITAYNGSDLTSNILNNERVLTLNAPTTFRFRFALWTDNAVYTNYKVGIAISTESISEYSEYTGDTVTIAFGQTVYGGVLDVTRGKLTVKTARLDLSDLNYSYNTTAGVAPYFYASISGVKYEGSFFSTVYNSRCNIYTCTKRDAPAFVDKTYCFDGSAPTVSQIQIKDLDYTDPVTFKASLTGAYIVYELDTPFDIDLTPEVISAVVGENNVYSDTNGDTTVQFKDSIQHYIDTRV